jgi:hypothetical protein
MSRALAVVLVIAGFLTFFWLCGVTRARMEH